MTTARLALAPAGIQDPAYTSAPGIFSECGSAGVRECGSAGVRECGSYDAGSRVTQLLPYPRAPVPPHFKKRRATQRRPARLPSHLGGNSALLPARRVGRNQAAVDHLQQLGDAELIHARVLLMGFGPEELVHRLG